MAIPLALKIIIGVILFLIILLFITPKAKGKYILIAIAVFVGLGVWQGLKEYNRQNVDLSNVKADIKISAVNLIHEYETNDSSSNHKYLGKIVEVDGNIKEIKSDEKGFYTIVLGDTSGLSSVRCSMDSTHQKDASKLVAGSSTVIRGSCTGFNKDELGLGSDVILNRCVIILKK